MDIPQYPGGKKAVNEFVSAHLQYPEDAMKQHIEGIVTVAYQVNDDGEVENPVVLKGLCPSCNEEAIRLVRLLKYGKAQNRGIRLKANCKIHIHFRLAPQEQQPTLNITYSSSQSAAKKKPAGGGYTISITLGK